MIAWLDEEALLALHDAVLATVGGAAGIADFLTFDRASIAPPAGAPISPDTVIVLAAAQALAIAERRPFVSGNLATAAAAMETVLNLNGLILAVAEEDIAVAIRAVAEGSWQAAQLMEWLNRSVRDV